MNTGGQMGDNWIVQEIVRKGYDKVIEDLQKHPSEAVYNFSCRILKRFFDVKEDQG
jgi:hypothetical protein